MKMRLIFRSGASTDVDVTEYTVKRNRIDNRFVGLDWVTPVGFAAKLSHVRLDEIAAVVTIAEPGDDGDNPQDDAPPVVSIPADAALRALDALERMASLEDDEVRAKGCEAAWDAIAAAIEAQAPPRGPLSRAESAERPSRVGQPTPEAPEGSEGSQCGTAGGAVVHHAPPDGKGVMPCCGRTPFEVPRTDRFAATDMFVTCSRQPERGAA